MTLRFSYKALGASLLAAALGMATAAMAQDGSTGKRLQIVNKSELRAPAGAVAAPAAYLMVYFKDENHSVHFAASEDGYSFTDLNGGQPVMLGKDWAEQKGVRDPHIMRGPDNAFYMSMTDLHIYAQREGLRSTEWERPGKDYGWGNNRGMIFMKSYDLVNWTYSLVRMDKLFKEYEDVGATWAPQTVYDPERKRLMVYYTTRIKNGANRLVYSYADQDFTTLTEAPKPLFTYPVANKGAIDGDITRVGDKYHMIYVTDDKPVSLRQAVSDRINGGYAFNPAKVDPETIHCEAPNVWRRIGTDTYVLMYDVFHAKPKNNMGFSETTDFVNFKNIGRFNDPGSPMKSTNFDRPKHGAVVHITAEELRRLKAYFGKSGAP